MIKLLVWILKKYAKINGIGISCVLNGSHRVKIIKSNNLYYEKEGQPIRYWFSGEYLECTDKNCRWSEFKGTLKPKSISREIKKCLD